MTKLNQTEGGKGLIYKCFIRAKVADRWGNYSIGELYDMGQLETIKYWFIDKALSLVGLSEGMIVERENLERGVKILKKLKAIVLLK